MTVAKTTAKTTVAAAAAPVAEAVKQIEDVVAVQKETIESVVKAGAEAATKGVEKAVSLTKEQVEAEFRLRPLFNVEEQVALLKDPTKIAAWMNGVATFMKSQGRITQKEFDRYSKANYFIEPKFMQMLAERRAAAAKK